MDEPGSVARLRARYVAGVGATALQVFDEGRTPAKAEELALLVGAYADAEVAAWRGRPDAPTGLACRSGCSHCCHAPIGVAIPEAVLIASVLREESTDDELAALRERARGAEAARSGLVGKARERSRHPCPLLDEGDGSCSLYEFRPLICRGWNSLDAERCEAYFDDPSGTSTIPIDGIQREIPDAIAAGVRAGLAARGLEDAPVDLAVALRILLEDPEAVDRWLAGDPAFREAEVPPG